MATLDHSLERITLPTSADAERSILGAILLSNDAYPQAAEILRPEDFALDSHRRIYQRMQDLFDASRPVDLITLVDELGRHREIEVVGGAGYLASLTDGLPRRENIEHYVRIVRNKALLRSLIHAANGAIARAMEQGETAEEILDAAESSIFEISERRIGRGLTSIKEIVKESNLSLDSFYKQGLQVTGLATHYVELDEITRGLQKSDLVVLAARPSMGKTALAMNIAENAAILDNKVVAVFSLEMSREGLLTRLLSSQARIDSHKMRSGFLGREEIKKLVDAFVQLSDAPIYIDDTPGLSIHEVRAKCRRLVQSQKQLDLVVVDYLQLMSATPSGGRRFENRTQEVSAISRGLKALAKELRVPVLALSQLSRAPESRGGDHRPMLSDLRESGSIEQDADLVAFIFREEVYMSADEALTKDVQGRAELIIAKQRNGPTGTVNLAFLKSSTRFENLARE